MKTRTERHPRVSEIIDTVTLKAGEERLLLRDAMEHLVLLLADSNDPVATALDDLLSVCAINRDLAAPLADGDSDEWQEWEGRNNG